MRLMNFVQMPVFVILALVSLGARGAEYPPQDHAGANLILANGDIIWGTHTNIGTFEIPTSVTVTVKPYDGDTTAGLGVVEVRANIIDIDGTLDATGSGYTGGGGGGGGGQVVVMLPGYSSPGGPGGLAPYGGGAFNGSAGSPNSSTSLVPGGNGGSGDGPFGGDGATTYYYSSPSPGMFLPGTGKKGGYAAPETNGDDSYDTSTLMGSGGGGNAGSQGYVSYGNGGAAGGRGGGAIRLIPESELHLGSSALIVSNGTFGQSNSGSSGGNVEPIATTGTGGAGAGGGILIDTRAAGMITVSAGAAIRSLGAADADGFVAAGMRRFGLPPDNNGGSVKIFFDGPVNPFAAADIAAGNVAPIPSSVDDWMNY